MPRPSIGRAFNRRRFLASAAAASAAGALAVSTAPRAAAQNAVLGTVLDYSAGVPSARSVKAAGHLGAVRYVSQRRPGADWMHGKPVSLAEAQDFKASGLATASVYQFGKDATADWLAGAAGAATHAPQAIALHKAAGGPTGRPIYVAVDDNPSRAQYEGQIRPYLRAFGAALAATGYQTGVYGNYNVIQWCVDDGIGSFFWMHDWGSGGKVHPRAQLHQVSKRQARIDGIECDINEVLAADWGQWTPGQAPAQTGTQQPGTPQPGTQQPGTSPITIPGTQIQVTPEMVEQAGQLSSQASSRLPGR
ncbi:DUF1906 domain-containing protein [Corynebacterium sp. UBA2622]|uniref:DUF1906 domain-containing protein n=1 Tax=Corynebacterium sp. UBA2622 TaxID=1946393 RepID=UPI0025C66857|nr:DUF1906 domain-containing protein [Corynebacterium sp. UBA2622]